MQCATLRRPRCSSLENVNVEQQQQSLFDVSIVKLQHEQLRHGVEPRLLRFVLINNALRSLQGHMLQIENEDSLMEITGAEVHCESSDVFLYNTFKNGSLSSLPLIPPTPVKMLKLDSNMANQSPLVEYHEAPCSPHDMLTSLPGEERVQPAACFEGVSCEVETEEVEGEEGKERRVLNGFSADAHLGGPHLGKRSRDWSHEEEVEGEGGGGSSRDNSKCRLSESKEVGLVGSGGEVFGGSEVKKPCKPPSLIINCSVQKVQNGLNSLNCLNGFLDLDPFPSLPFPSSPPSPSLPSPLSPSSLQQTPHYHHTNHYTSPSEDSCDKDSLTPSPIDFTNVDPTLYDFDTAVLHVESTDNVPVLDTHSEASSLPSIAMTPLPSPASPSASSPVTLTSSTTSALSCSPLVATTPVLSPLPAQYPISSAAVVSAEPPLQQQLQQERTKNATSSTPYLEPEKLSLLSADSMVSTYPPGGGASKGGSCSMEALVRAQNGGDLLSEDDEDCSLDNGRSLGDTNGRSLPTSPEHAIETDCMDEIEHIVKLLMT